MKQDIWDFIKVILLMAAIIFVLGSCSDYENEKLESKIEEAWQEGYDYGYRVGYERGAEDQKQADFEEFTIDTWSIIDVVNEVYKEYGMTPHEAFAVYDEYNYDWTHGGISWDEYQKALEVMYYTASVFPCE